MFINKRERVLGTVDPVQTHEVMPGHVRLFPFSLEAHAYLGQVIGTSIVNSFPAISFFPSAVTHWHCVCGLM